ncbi:MAG: ABC-F family ATP-binding cassette domain-containing protein [Clostridiales bacterium]|nr:ABC-F family ATP-binding cassette domain-containing protein [Clostridiales bacterium]
MLLQIQDGSLSIGGQTILSHFNFEIKGKEKIALVGRNGSGKTTLLRLLAGELSLDRDDHSQGMGMTASRRLTIGLLAQQAFSDASGTVEEELLKACPCPDRWDRERFAWEQEYDRILTGFGLTKEDKKKPVSQFSGGEQTKLALIRLLLEKPDILLLDEPTNHLDMETAEWLEDYLRSYEHAAVIVSHDRFFLDQVADTVCEIQDKRLIRYTGGYTAYREQKQKDIKLQEKAYQHQQEEIKRLEELIERFKHKPKKAAFARSRKKILERMPRVDRPVPDDAHIFTGEIVPAVNSSKWVLEAEHLQVGYEKTLLELSLRIRRGQKIGIIGPNGAGKSTFLKTAAGLLPPVKGKLSLGLQVLVGYFDQQTAALTSDKTVAEHFHDLFPSLTEKEVRSTLGAFLFPGKEAGKKVSGLSGGEKSRLVLAELFQSRPNFFLLDEPTNHMDIPARETLESAFRAYKGTLLFVSHDRYFIRQVAEALLIFEDQTVLYYPFGYAHYVEHCRKKASGMSPSAQIRAEEQALLSGLQNVPKAERHRLRDIPTELAYADWQLRLALEPLEEIQTKLTRFYEDYDVIRMWEDPSYAEEIQKKEEELHQTYTEICLNWFEKWKELTNESY